jgi:uncharacterized protein YjaG (DUF416 family)
MMSATNAGDDFFRLSPFLAGLRDQLSSLSTAHQVAFALYCCERLYPSYLALAKRIGSEGAGILRSLLDELWEHLHAPPVNEEQVERFENRLQGIELGEEACCDEWDGGVDAVGAVALALGAWSEGSAASAAKAAGNVLNRVHQRLMDEAVGRTYALSADEMMAVARRIEQQPAMKTEREQLLEIVEVLKQRPALTEADARHLRSLGQARA